MKRLYVEQLEPRQMLSLTVTTLVDELDGSIIDGDVSLRDAVAMVFSTETVDFAPSLFADGPATLQLTSQLRLSRELTLHGPGADLLTIAGGIRSDRANLTITNISITAGLQINAGLSRVLIRECTISGGVTATTGGVSYNWMGGNVRFENCTVSGGMQLTPDPDEYQYIDVRGCTVTGGIIGNSLVEVRDTIYDSMIGAIERTTTVHPPSTVGLNLADYVPNLDFESYTALPTNIGQMKTEGRTVNDWKQLHYGTPEYFHDDSWMGPGVYPAAPPDMGTAPTPISGKGFVGVIDTDPAAYYIAWHEYVVNALPTPLALGTTYRLDLFAGTSSGRGFVGAYVGELVLYGMFDPTAIYPWNESRAIEVFGGNNFVELLAVDVDQAASTWTAFRSQAFTTPTDRPITAIVFGARTSRAHSYLLIDASAPVDPDYNHDATVDAADYVVWRKLGIGDYNAWATQFAETDEAFADTLLAVDSVKQKPPHKFSDNMAIMRRAMSFFSPSSNRKSAMRLLLCVVSLVLFMMAPELTFAGHGSHCGAAIQEACGSHGGGGRERARRRDRSRGSFGGQGSFGGRFRGNGGEGSFGGGGGGSHGGQREVIVHEKVCAECPTCPVIDAPEPPRDEIIDRDYGRRDQDRGLDQGHDIGQDPGIDNDPGRKDRGRDEPSRVDRRKDPLGH